MMKTNINILCGNSGILEPVRTTPVHTKRLPQYLTVAKRLKAILEYEFG